MKIVVRCLIGLVVLAALAWGGGWLVTNHLNHRYAALTTAAEAALVRGDAKAAAGAAVAAMHGRDLALLTFDNSRATALLRDALMAGQAPLTQTGTQPFPRFVSTGDVIPAHTGVGSDGKRLMILQNEDRTDWIIDIYALPSGRLLRRFPLDASVSDKVAGAVAGFSPDLATTIITRTDGVYFRDSETGRPVLTALKSPEGFYGWTVSNDRRLVTARGDKGLRVWDLGASAAVSDIPYGVDGYADDFGLAPGGKVAVTGAMSLGSGGNSRAVIDLPSQKVRLSWKSNGPIDATFSQDGRYVVTSAITGETPDHLTWTHGTRVWDLASGRPVGPWLDFGYPETAQTLFQRRIMVITAMDGARFFDLETGRLMGTSVSLPNAMGGSSTVTETAAYAVDWNHVLISYRLTPILAMTVAALTVEACHRWRPCG